LTEDIPDDRPPYPDDETLREMLDRGELPSIDDHPADRWSDHLDEMSGAGVLVAMVDALEAFVDDAADASCGEA
jgi:hypothetical protein